MKYKQFKEMEFKIFDTILDSRTLKTNDTPLKFGTAGIRGEMAPGDNYINSKTILKATAAVGEYFKTCKHRTVLVGYDGRVLSSEYAQLTAYKLQRMGFNVILSNRSVPTPVFSLCMSMLNAVFGVMITASHNPMQFNGYKLFIEDGKQAEADVTDEIQKLMSSTLDYELKDYEDVDRTFLYFGPLEIFKSYVSASYKRAKNEMSLMYSPMYGVGEPYMATFLEMVFGTHYMTVPEHRESQVFLESANPEEPAAWETIFKQPIDKKDKPDLIFATDPDSDRISFCAKTAKNDYILFKGQEIAIMLTAYLAETRDVKYKDTIVKSNVTTDVVERIWPGMTVNVPVGFKNIAEKMDPHFVAGFEESCGFNLRRDILDKDPYSSIFEIINMANFVKKTYGVTLDEYLDIIYDRYDLEAEFLTKSFTGDEETIKKGIEEIVSHYVKYKVELNNIDEQVIFYNNSIAKTKITIRKSGTENKTKLYIDKITQY